MAVVVGVGVGVMVAVGVGVAVVVVVAVGVGVAMNDDPVISPRYSQAREIARLKRRIYERTINKQFTDRLDTYLKERG